MQRNLNLTLVLVIGLASLAGCGRRGPKTYAVNGKVQLGQETDALAGSHVEAALSTDARVRASGVLDAQGRFTLQTYQAGEIQYGAPAGTYRVRIILQDDDVALRRHAVGAIPPRYLDFETSGLTLEVPTRGETAFDVSTP